MIDLLDLPTNSFEMKKIYLNKGTNISTILQEKPSYPITFNIISFDNKTYSFSFDCLEEINEGLRCACENISNGKGYIIKDDNDQKQTNYYRNIDEIEYIYHNGTYRILIDENELQQGLESFLRKYENQFPIESHHEVQVALKQMSFGEFFYKCNPKNCRIQFIYMRADNNLKQLEYYSRKDIIKYIPYNQIQNIKLGVNNDNIRNTFKNRFQDTSLTIIFKNEENIFSSFISDSELHLNFRTERQFDVWTTGLKSILQKNICLNISKKNLLSHSRLFKRFMLNNEFQLIDSFFNNSEIYNKNISQGWTYETTLLDRRIDFCFEKQIDDLKNEKNIFDKFNKDNFKYFKDEINKGNTGVLDLIVKNVYNNSKIMINQIVQMKQMIDDYQKNKIIKAQEVDLLEIHNDNSNQKDAFDDKENLFNIENLNSNSNNNNSNNNKNTMVRAKQINYLYGEVFKFQFRLHQSICFLQNVNIKIKNY